MGGDYGPNRGDVCGTKSKRCCDFICGLSVTFGAGQGVCVLFGVGKCCAGSVYPVFARDS